MTSVFEVNGARVAWIVSLVQSTIVIGANDMRDHSSSVLGQVRHQVLVDARLADGAPARHVSVRELGDEVWVGVWWLRREDLAAVTERMRAYAVK